MGNLCYRKLPTWGIFLVKIWICNKLSFKWEFTLAILSYRHFAPELYAPFWILAPEKPFPCPDWCRVFSVSTYLYYILTKFQLYTVVFGVKPPEPLDYKLHCDFVLVYIGIFGICNMSLIIIHLRSASLTLKENNPH